MGTSFELIFILQTHNLDFFEFFSCPEKNDAIYWKKRSGFSFNLIAAKGYVALINWSYDQDADIINTTSQPQKTAQIQTPHRKSVNCNVFL